jgi:hypothetical protein
MWTACLSFFKKSCRFKATCMTFFYLQARRDPQEEPTEETDWPSVRQACATARNFTTRNAHPTVEKGKYYVTELVFPGHQR